MITASEAIRQARREGKLSPRTNNAIINKYGGNPYWNQPDALRVSLQKWLLQFEADYRNHSVRGIGKIGYQEIRAAFNPQPIKLRLRLAHWIGGRDGYTN